MALSSFVRERAGAVRGRALGVLILVPLVPSDAARGQEAPGPEAAPPPHELRVEWKAQTFAPDALPDELRRAKREIEAWAEWALATAQPYRILVSEDAGMVSLLLPEPEEGPVVVVGDDGRRNRNKGADRKLKNRAGGKKKGESEEPPAPAPTFADRVTSVQAALDEMLPAPRERIVGKAQWEKDALRMLGATGVVVMVEDEAAFHDVLERAARANPYMADFVERAKRAKLTGCVLEKPLLGVVMRSPEGMSEFSLENELVKRCAELALIQRFGWLPFWARDCAASYFEFQELGTFYSFTGGERFVAAADGHADKEERARQLLRNGRFEDDEAFFQALAHWHSDTWDEDAAACGAVLFRYLAQEHRVELPRIFEGWRAEMEKGGNEALAGGRWSKNTAYGMPPETALRVLRESGVGEHPLLDELLRFAGG